MLIKHHRYLNLSRPYDVVTPPLEHQLLDCQWNRPGRAKLLPLGLRTFGDLLGELDMYSLIRTRVLSKGSIGYDERDRLIRQTAYRVDVVDSVGAGDAYHGAIIYAAIHGWSLDKAMQLGSACGALCCTQLSGRTGLPTLRQAQRFLGRQTDHGDS